MDSENNKNLIKLINNELNYLMMKRIIILPHH